MVKKPEPLKVVRVVAPYRVVHNCVAYSVGDMPEVPKALADEWVRAGWVTTEE